MGIGLEPREETRTRSPEEGKLAHARPQAERFLKTTLETAEIHVVGAGLGMNAHVVVAELT